MVALATCVVGLAAADPDEQWAEVVYACGLGVASLSWTALGFAASARRRAIRECVRRAALEPPSRHKMYWRLVEFEAYREAEYVLMESRLGPQERWPEY